MSAAYRVGALGFLSLESAGIVGNFAVQDLLLALEWVQHNIAAFGGDPVRASIVQPLTHRRADSYVQDQVLVFGQSAGAGLTWILSALPQSPKLMSAAISESGAGRILASKEQYQIFGQAYASSLGCNVTDVRLLFPPAVLNRHLQML